MADFCEFVCLLFLGPMYESIMYYSCCLSNKYNQIIRIRLIRRRIIAYKGLKILIEVKLGRKIELTLRKVQQPLWLTCSWQALKLNSMRGGTSNEAVPFYIQCNKTSLPNFRNSGIYISIDGEDRETTPVQQTEHFTLLLFCYCALTCYCYLT